MKKTNRIHIHYLIQLILCSYLFFSCNTEKKKPKEIEEKKPPNVLMIAVDDLNTYLSYFGDSNAKTPNINTLASNGVAFTNAHCQAPLCGPSRASIMTGLRPSTTGIYGMIKDDQITSDNEVTKDIIFLPAYFKNHGYVTKGVGKIFHTFAPKGVFTESPGRFVGETPNNSFGPAPEKRIAWPGYRPDSNVKKPKTNTDWGAFPEHDSLMSDYKAVQWATRQLMQGFEDKPFFLAIGLLRPHVPLHVPQKWFDLYPLDQIELPPYQPNDFDDIPDIVVEKINHLPMMPTTEWAIKTNNWKKIMQAYLACVSFIDHQVGLLLKALEESKYAEDTIIILWSDHGYRVGEKGTFAKHSLWNEATKAPLILKGPKIPKKKTIHAPVELLSIYPTLLELAGLPAYEKNEGKSLVPLINDEYQIDKEKQYAITTYGWSNHSVRTHKYRYTQYEDNSEELYDQIKDPNEFVNLANKQEYDSIKKELRKLFPKTNKNWHKHSNYRFQSYFSKQKERLDKASIKKEN